MTNNTLKSAETQSINQVAIKTIRESLRGIPLICFKELTNGTRIELLMQSDTEYRSKVLCRNTRQQSCSTFLRKKSRLRPVISVNVFPI